MLGATGFTGERIARALAARNADLILAARRRAPLEQLAAELHVKVPVRVVESLRETDKLVEGAAVVLNTIGPFRQYGLPIVAAALANQAHYVDITGEQAFMRTVLDMLDGPAKARGVAVLCAQAFEYAFGYCGSAALAERFGVPEKVEVFYRTRGGGVSHGTAQSVVGMLREKLMTFRSGRLVPIRGKWNASRVRFPGEERDYSVIPFPGGEPLFVPRALPGVRDVNDYLIMPRSVAAWATRLLAARPLLQGALAVPGSERAVSSAITRVMREPGEDKLAESRFAVLVRGVRGAKRYFCRIDGRDVYGITAQIAAQVALWLAAGRARSAGVLSTDQAFGPRALLEALAPFGVTFELGEE